MIELHIYARRNGQWCAQAVLERGGPACWWSDWYTDLARCLTDARSKVKELWPGKQSDYVLVKLAGPRALKLHRQRFAGRDSDPL